MTNDLRDRDLDLFRCIAVCMIVLLHAWGAASQYAVPNSWELRTWTFLAAHCTSAAMPALFLISGYLLFRNYTLSSWPVKIGRRIRRLMVPYVCWNIVFVLFYLVCGHFFSRINARISSFGLTTLQGCLAKIIHPFIDPIDYPVWYMRTIFVFALLSPALWIFLQHRMGRWAIFGVVCLYFGACEANLLPEVPGYPSYAILTLVSGSFLATAKKPISQFFSSPWWIVPGALSILLFSCPLFGSSSPLGYTTLSLLLTPLFFNLIHLFTHHQPPTTNHQSRITNHFLFFLYTGHFLFCSVWVHALAPMMTSFENGKLTILIFLFLLPGISTLFAAHVLGKRFLPKLIHFFDGSL